MGVESKNDEAWAGSTHPYCPGAETGSEGAYCSVRLAGRYLVGRLIGSGGTSQVYEALQVNLHRGVAIKVLHPTLADDQSLAECFHREALLASQLSHPNIVQIVDCCFDALVGPYIVTELFLGPTLAELMASETPDILRAIARVRQVLEALSYAHSAGVVHADLKPANIMVEFPPSGEERLKLVDFGAALPCAGSTGASDVFHGTPSYLAPEVSRGQRPTFAADIYAAGIFFYESLTGELPFVASSLEELLELHRSAAPPSLFDSRHVAGLGLDPALLAKGDAIIRRALAKNPSERYDSADSFRRAVDALAAELLRVRIAGERAQEQAALRLLEAIERLASCPADAATEAELCANWLALGHLRQAMGENDSALVAGFRALQLSIRTGSRKSERRSDELIAALLEKAPMSESVAQLRRVPFTIAPRRARRATPTGVPPDQRVGRAPTAY